MSTRYRGAYRGPCYRIYKYPGGGRMVVRRDWKRAVERGVWARRPLPPLE